MIDDMISSIGIDLVEVERIKRITEHHGERFLRKILGPDEALLYKQRFDKHVFLSGRLAAKEAAIKALGKFLSARPLFHQIQIINDHTGQPFVQFADDVKEKLHGISGQVSISHEKSHAVAIVVLTEEK
jgi:holo-[acyl-carrier protein] synthase